MPENDKIIPPVFRDQNLLAVTENPDYLPSLLPSINLPKNRFKNE